MARIVSANRTPSDTTRGESRRFSRDARDIFFRSENRARRVLSEEDDADVVCSIGADKSFDEEFPIGMSVIFGLVQRLSTMRSSACVRELFVR